MSSGGAGLIDLPEISAISLLANNCLRKFLKLFGILRDLHPPVDIGLDIDSARLSIEEAQAGFKAWGTNIAAFEDGKLPTSLDYRLNEAPAIKGGTLQILRDLEEYLDDGNLNRAIPSNLVEHVLISKSNFYHCWAATKHILGAGRNK